MDCGSRKEIDPTLAAKSAAKMGHPARRLGARHDPFGGVRVVRWILHHCGMDKTREFWLRLGVIVGALILSSAMLAFLS